MTPVRPPHAMRPVCETMEDRILHSADLAPLLVGDGGDGLALQQSVQTSANDPLARSSEIVFVDLSVPDAGTLLADLQAQRDAGRAIDIFTIAADQDGLALITDTLANRKDITAVHVLAHGSDGVMQLGQSRLDASTLMARADMVAAWAGALAADADLLLYGCDFAQTGVGQQMVRDLAALTGADVAASTDTTGAATLGGNWTLEYGTGRVESALALSAAGQQAWSGTLAVGFTSESSSGTTVATTSFAFAHNINGGSDRLLLVSLVLGDSASSATAVAFNGEALSFVGTQNSPNANVRVELWSLVAPTIGAGTVNVTLSSASTMAVGATSYSGVDQATPLGTPVKGSGNGATASVAVPASSGDLVVDIVGARQVSSFGIGANQTQNFVQTQGTGASELSAVSTRESGATSVTMSNSLTSADLNWASIAVQLRQVPASGLLADTPIGTSGGNPLAGTGTGIGWAGNWSGSGSKITQSNSSLSYAGGLLPSSGGSAQFQLQGGLFIGDSTTGVRNLSTSVGADGTTTWISFLVQPNTNGFGNEAGLQFGSTTLGFAGFDGNQFVLREGNSAQTAVSGVSASAGQTYLLVLKLEHFAGADTLTLYVNPTPGLTAPDSALTATRSFDLGTFTRIALTGSTGVISGNSAKFDEIRVGQTYAAVAPTATPAIISGGGGATASYSIAENNQNVATIRAVDYNTASPTYSINGGADAALFEINSSTGLLRFKNAPDFETRLDANFDNVYEVVVRVSDGTFSDTQAISVTVVDIANGPLTVTTTSDVYDGDVSSIEALFANRGSDGQISLREAITAANNTAGTDTILFGVNGIFTLASGLGTGDDNNTKGDLDIKGSLIIIGNGSANTVIQGFGSDRVFDLRSGASTVVMSGLTIQGGGDEDGGAMRINSSVTVTLTDVVIRNNNGKNGGAILNEGNLTITRGSLTGNTAVNNDGGAIYNTGTLVLNQVELGNNAATGSHKGGAIYNKGAATLTEVWAHDNTAEEGGALWVSGSGNMFNLTQVTLNANSASKDGGAIFGENGATLTAINVTISGNTAGEYGGAIRVKTTNWTLTNATIANNQSTLGAGAIHADDVNAVRLKSSILASNTSAAGAGLNVSNLNQNSTGNNLATQATGWLSKPGDIITTATALQLQALAANGGFAPTHALAIGSTAIDQGGSSAPSTDQRGVSRVGAPDIGAYEYNLGNAAPTVSAIGSQTVDEDATLGPLAFTIGDAETAASALTVTATSLNTTLLPNAGIVLGGSGANLTITLTPAPNANSALDGGPVTVRISVSDGVNTTTRDFLLTVNPTADDPVAVNDLAATAAGTPVVVAVLGNDYDVDGDSLVIQSASLQNGSQGNVSFTNATITFTPSVTGVVLINYTVRDSTGRISNTAVLTVNVGANNAPGAAGGMVALNEDGSRAIVLANLGYSDPDGHAFTALRVDSLPTAGSLWFDGEPVTSAGLIVDAAALAANKLVFMPTANGNGAAYATMQFSVQDSQGAFSASSGTLTFNVTAQADPPSVVDDTATTLINLPIDVNVLTNDSHPDGTPMSVTSVVLDDPSQGTAAISFALDASGSVLFTPAGDISGEVVIRYTVSDGTASAIGTLRVTVGANTAPSSANNTVSVAEDGSYTVQTADISYFDPDAGQSFAAVRIDQLPLSGSLFIGGVAAQVGDSVTAAQLAGGALVYQPAANGNGSPFDQMLFSVVDSAGARSISYNLGFNVTPVNDAPLASGSASLAAIDEDVTLPPGATVAALFGGNFSDIADAGNAAHNQFAGVAVTGQTVDLTQGSWQYSINNGLIWQNIGSVSDSNALTLRSSDLLRFLPMANFAGVPNDLTVRLIDNSTSVTGGATNVNVTSNGGTSAYSAQTVNLSTAVTDYNDAPTISTTAGGTIGVTEDLASTITGISFNDIDGGIGNFTATFTVASGSLSATTTPLVAVSGGGTTLTLSGSLLNLNLFLSAGGLSYTTAPDATTSVTLTILVDDGGNTGTDPGLSGTATSESASATVTLVVTAVNDDPTVNAGAPITVIEDTASPLTGIAFSDVDAGSSAVTASFTVLSGSLSASAGSGVGVGGSNTALTLTGAIADINSFMANGRLLFTTAAGATANVNLAIAINDGGNSGSGPVGTGVGGRSLQVSALNKAPTISTPAGFNVIEDVPGVIDGIVFADADAGTALVSVFFTVDSGTLGAGVDASLQITGSGTTSLSLVGTVGNINSFIAAGKLSFTTATDATASINLSTRIDDGGNSGVGGARSASTGSQITVTAVNDAPVLASAIGDRNSFSGDPMLFQVPAATFVDPDAGDTLQYSATLAQGGALPAWLRFDPQTRTFSGTPADSDAGSLVIRVVARDGAGAMAQTQFAIRVSVALVNTVESGTGNTSTPTPTPKTEETSEKPLASAVAPTADNGASRTDLAQDSGIDVAETLSSQTPGVEIDTNVQIVQPRPVMFFEVATTMPVAQGDAVLAQALTTQFNKISSSESSQLFGNDDLLRKLEELRRQMEQPGSNQQIMTASSIALTSGLSIGYVIWLIRGGILVSSMLSALPAWQMIDPLPVLATSGRGPRKEGADTDEPGGVDAFFDDKSAVAPVAPVAPVTAAAVAAVPTPQVTDTHKNTQEPATP